jgi:hypothetical protein
MFRRVVRSTCDFVVADIRLPTFTCSKTRQADGIEMFPAEERPTSIETQFHEPAWESRRTEMSPEQNSFQPFGQNNPKAK